MKVDLSIDYYSSRLPSGWSLLESGLAMDRCESSERKRERESERKMCENRREICGAVALFASSEGEKVTDC